MHPVGSLKIKKWKVLCKYIKKLDFLVYGFKFSMHEFGMFLIHWWIKVLRKEKFSATLICACNKKRNSMHLLRSTYIDI
jgi:hypothetical protein